jgi:hypothetical protein
MCFGLVCTDKLAQGDGTSERKSEKSCSGEHYCFKKECREFDAVFIIDTQDFILIIVIYHRIAENMRVALHNFAQVTTTAVGPTAAWENSGYCARKFGFDTEGRGELRDFGWSSDKERKRQGWE